MKNKKILKEQTQTPDNLTVLKKALEIGCFDELIELEDGLNLDKEPSQVNGEIIIKATGKKSNIVYNIKPHTKIGTFLIVKADEPTKYNWFSCSALNYVLQNPKKETPPTTTPATTPTVTTSAITTEPTEKKVEEIIKDLQTQKEEQTPESCVDSINALYKFYKDAQKGYKFDDDNVKILRDNSQKCLNNPEIKNKLLFSKLPLVGDRFQKKLKELFGINQLGVYAKFSLMEAKSVNKLVKLALNEAKERKENEKIQNEIIVSRLGVMKESIENFEKYGLKKQVKIGFKTLREFSEMQRLGILNENLGSLFKGMYGKSFDTSVGSITEPLFNVIFTKILLDDDMKQKALQNIQSKTQQLIASMENCQDLSKFLSDILVEEFAKKLDMQKQEPLNILDATYMDAVDDEIFRRTLYTKLETEICKLYDKFTENAKNLMVRLTSL